MYEIVFVSKSRSENGGGGVEWMGDIGGVGWLLVR